MADKKELRTGKALPRAPYVAEAKPEHPDSAAYQITTHHFVRQHWLGVKISDPEAAAVADQMPNTQVTARKIIEVSIPIIAIPIEDTPL